MKASSKDHPIISVLVRSISKEVDEKLEQVLSETLRSDLAVRVRKAKAGHYALEGWSEAQLEGICDRICEESIVGIEVGEPEAILLAAIRETVVGEGKYIRQTGGSGNYGHCKLRVEPNGRGSGYEFINALPDSRIPEEFIRSIASGVERCVLDESRPGHPLVDLKVTLTDGSFHETDSNSPAFEMAAGEALNRALRVAGIVTLEPMMKVQIGLPSQPDIESAIARDVAERRGRIVEVQSENGWIGIEAIMPLIELLALNSEGIAAFPMEFAGYEAKNEDDRADEIGTRSPHNRPRRPRNRYASEQPPCEDEP